VIIQRKKFLTENPRLLSRGEETKTGPEIPFQEPAVMREPGAVRGKHFYFSLRTRKGKKAGSQDSEEGPTNSLFTARVKSGAVRVEAGLSQIVKGD